MEIIQLKDVWEAYRIKFAVAGKVSWEDFWALKGISFDVGKGETLGIIGENGAGKSTILRLIAGMIKPDRGEITISGRISGLLELGAGFQTELTGRDNIYLSAGLFGLNQRQIEERFEEIVNFASIGKFIDAPVKCYSQGMFVRLAFAIAIHVDPDILLIDDTLAVGDEFFQRKCVKKIFELKEQGKTIILVTHDMNMLSRICERAIFLKEGRIIRDGVKDRVIPLYAQMIGAKEGIGRLECKDLSLIFNNGRILLNWKDRLITANSGAYTTFLIKHKWHSSLQADWEVKPEGQNRLLAIGKFYQLSMTQIWQLELGDNYNIKWDIEAESEEPIEIQEACTNIMLTSGYSNWLTPLEAGEFPPIEDKIKTWQALLEGNMLRKCLSVEGKDAADDKLPSLAFEELNPAPRSQAQILNTDYLANARVLQYKTLGVQNYSATRASRLVYFSGNIVVGIQDINNYLKKLQDEFILSNGKSKLIFNNGQCIISYNGLAITKRNNIGVAMCVNGKWYSSESANWGVKKETKDRLVAKGTWSNLPVEQIWEIEINGESSFVWRVKLRVNQEINIEEGFIRFMCNQDYKYWFSEYGKGNFPEGFLENELDMLQRCIPDGPVGLQSQNNKYPTLCLKFPKGSDNFAKIFNSDFYNKARILLIAKVQPENNFRFAPGEYLWFDFEVKLSGQKKVSPEDLINMIQYGRLEFIFDNGKGHIYRDGQELTKRLGLYTSLRSQGRWYDSASSAIWQTTEKNISIIRVSGRWLHLPIRQDWEIRLKGGGLIELETTLKVDREIEVDRLQTNLMLSENYREWIANSYKGNFPQFNGNIDDDWEVLWSNSSHKDKKKDYVGLLKNSIDNASFPKIMFLPEDIDSGWSLNIVNSDLYHRGRVLQYLKNEKKILSPGEYRYFRGSIKIEES